MESKWSNASKTMATKLRLGWNSYVDGFYAALELVSYKGNNPRVEQITDVAQKDGEFIETTRDMELDRVDGNGRVMIKVYALENDPGVYRLRDVVHAAGRREDLMVTLRNGEVTLIENEAEMLAKLAAYFGKRNGRHAQGQLGAANA